MTSSPPPASAPPMYGDGDIPIYPVLPCEKGALITKVDIHVECSNLKDRDYLSKSDPMIVMFKESKNISSKQWKEIDRTETVKNDLNPKFVKSFLIEYCFEELQKLKFEVYDMDSTKAELDEHDFLGKIEVHLGSIVGEYGGKVTKPLYKRDGQINNSNITFSAEEIADNKEVVELQFQGKKLEKKDFFGSSDPFLIFYRHGIENTDYVPVHKTEVVKNCSNPYWKRFTVPIATLCNGDKHRPIRIDCYDWDNGGRHSLIGTMQTTLCELLTEKQFSRELVNPKKNAKKKHKNSGLLNLCFSELRNEPSFLDYITGGIDLCFHVAIDFTASNGNPNQPSSLHFRDMISPNKYLQALTSVGQICEDYDTDKLIPAYGFGAKISGTVYHDFPLNQTRNPACYGIPGVITAYHDYLTNADLYGPTNFSPVINLVAEQARQETVVQKYHVLLILTDGIISDMDQTKLAIINASKLPVSIIIVGIGEANFDAMSELDSDNGNLSFQGRVAEQDIVQFVPYRNFSGSFAADDLAREVLYEVPSQLKSFMRRKGVIPRSGYQKGLVHSVRTNGIQNSYVTKATVSPPESTRRVSAPPLPCHIHYGNSNMQQKQNGLNKHKLCDDLNKKQSPYAPGHIPKQMSAKEAALLILSKH